MKKMLKQRFEDALDISIPPTRLNGRPSFMLDILQSADKYNNLLAIFKEMIGNFSEVNKLS